jgi:hypothetical protein
MNMNPPPPIIELRLYIRRWLLGLLHAKNFANDGVIVIEQTIDHAIINELNYKEGTSKDFRSKRQSFFYSPLEFWSPIGFVDYKNVAE